MYVSLLGADYILEFRFGIQLSYMETVRSFWVFKICWVGPEQLAIFWGVFLNSLFWSIDLCVYPFANLYCLNFCTFVANLKIG